MHHASPSQFAHKPDSSSSELVTLNLIHGYPVRWSEYKTLRDFVQNFYDAVGWQEWGARFRHQLTDGVLELTALETGFSYEWLLHIGASTKQASVGEYAGYFGEGFKIAALCAIRDHHWQVQVRSRDWELEVTTSQVKVEDRWLQSLAYRLWRNRPYSPHTSLQLWPFDNEKLLQCVLLSFYGRENPLLGARIWESHQTAIYHRSKTPKPQGYPHTDDDVGEGIVFAGYQALGSMQTPLVVCDHGFRRDDRERNSFFRMHVVDLVRSVCQTLSAEAAVEVLEVLESRWYERPRKKWDFHSWHSIIDSLVYLVSTSDAAREDWRKKYPRLLVAPLVKRSNLPACNRRRQALAWLRSTPIRFRLVQEGFAKLGYPTLEQACEEAGGFALTRPPTSREQQRIRLLEEIVRQLVPDFPELPLCVVIKSEDAVWQGMATCIPIRKPTTRFRDVRVRFDLPYVALKPRLLSGPQLGPALSTYLHELAHMFGGDRSASFSLILSEFMEVTLRHVGQIAEYEQRWAAMQERVG